MPQVPFCLGVHGASLKSSKAQLRKCYLVGISKLFFICSVNTTILSATRASHKPESLVPLSSKSSPHVLLSRVKSPIFISFGSHSSGPHRLNGCYRPLPVSVLHATLRVGLQTLQPSCGLRDQMQTILQCLRPLVAWLFLCRFVLSLFLKSVPSCGPWFLFVFFPLNLAVQTEARVAVTEAPPMESLTH